MFQNKMLNFKVFVIKAKEIKVYIYKTTWDNSIPLQSWP